MNYSICLSNGCFINNRATIAGWCVSLVLFSTAVVLVLAFKLHRILVYRLALYQVVSANLCLVVPALTTFSDNDFDVQFAVGVSIVCLKLFLSLWINFHLFVLFVCHKNLQRLELLYVGSPIIVALGIYILTQQFVKDADNFLQMQALDMISYCKMN